MQRSLLQACKVGLEKKNGRGASLNVMAVSVSDLFKVGLRFI